MFFPESIEKEDATTAYVDCSDNLDHDQDGIPNRIDPDCQFGQTLAIPDHHAPGGPVGGPRPIGPGLTFNLRPGAPGEDGPIEAINFLSIINRNTGEVHLLSDPAIEASQSLTGIAINRIYETCDQGGFDPDDTLRVPLGARCSETCRLIESDRTDGIDNDFDGLIDCADVDCLNRVCYDGNPCTDGTCVNGECESVADDNNVYDDGDQCTDDACVNGDYTGKLADNKTDLLDGEILTAINVNQFGEDVSRGDSNEVWTKQPQQ